MSKSLVQAMGERVSPMAPGLTVCPTCGRPLDVRRNPDRETAYQTVRPLSPYVLGAVAGATERSDWRTVEYREPARAASREADVIVPALQAVITGMVAGLLVGTLVLLVTVARGWPWYGVPASAMVAGVVTASVQWLRLLSESRALLVKVETWTRRDLDGDGVIGKGASDTLRVEYIEETQDGRHWEIDDLPISREQLRRIVRSVEGGANQWSRRELATFPGIGSDRARQILDQLVTHRYLHYPHGLNHPDGAQPTAKGRAMFRGLLG